MKKLFALILAVSMLAVVGMASAYENNTITVVTRVIETSVTSVTMTASVIAQHQSSRSQCSSQRLSRRSHR